MHLIASQPASQPVREINIVVNAGKGIEQTRLNTGVWTNVDTHVLKHERGNLDPLGGINNTNRAREVVRRRGKALLSRAVGFSRCSVYSAHTKLQMR